jgi:hypothetical protein
MNRIRCAGRIAFGGRIKEKYYPFIFLFLNEKGDEDLRPHRLKN